MSPEEAIDHFEQAFKLPGPKSSEALQEWREEENVDEGTPRSPHTSTHVPMVLDEEKVSQLHRAQAESARTKSTYALKYVLNSSELVQ